MTHLTVRFCIGCGHVLDELQPSDREPCWIAAHVYREKYGIGLDKLHLIEVACPPCARVLACVRHRTSPEAQGERTCAVIGQEQI